MCGFEVLLDMADGDAVLERMMNKIIHNNLPTVLVNTLMIKHTWALETFYH